jgi:hypothetical protein
LTKRALADILVTSGGFHINPAGTTPGAVSTPFLRDQPVGEATSGAMGGAAACE